MKVVHLSPYPGINIPQFHRLMADDAYQDALAVHGKVTRHNVKTALQPDGLVSSWDTHIHRTLQQRGLRPLRAFWPNGVTVAWSEEHEYRGDKGTLRLQLRQPSIVEAILVGAETLVMEGDTLMRRIEIDLAQSTIPFAMRYIPGVMGAIAREVDAGLSRSDDCTLTWLTEHRNEYVASEEPVEAGSKQDTHESSESGAEHTVVARDL